MINYLYNNNNNKNDKKLTHKLRISIFVKQACIYKNSCSYYNKSFVINAMIFVISIAFGGNYIYGGYRYYLKVSRAQNFLRNLECTPLNLPPL